MTHYRFRPDAPVGDEVRRIATDQVDLALADLDRDDDEAVHEVRRRCKKLRALVRLVHGAAKDLQRRENTAFRDLARTVSDVRDDAAMVECFDPLVQRYATVVDAARLAPVRDALCARRDAHDAGLAAQIATVREGLATARERIAAWPLPGDGGFDVLRGGLGRSYRRACSRGRDARDRPSTAALHEWRKRVKDHRYQVQLLQDCWPRVLKARRRELHELTDLLGDDHDLAVLRDTLHADVDRHGGDALVSACTALIDHRRGELQERAHRLGRRCFADRPDALVARFETYWHAWRDTAEHARVT